MGWYVAASLQALRAEVNASAPQRSTASDGTIGDPSHSARTSDHNPCDCHDAVCAIDLTHDPAGGFDSYTFANWLAARLPYIEARVKYVISNGRIASGQGQSYPAGVWRPYDGSNPHDHHVHVSVRHGPELFDDAHQWDWWGDQAVTDPEPDDAEVRPEMFLIFDGETPGQARHQAVVVAGQTINLTDQQFVHAVANSAGVPSLHLHPSTPEEVWTNLIRSTANLIEG